MIDEAPALPSQTNKDSEHLRLLAIFHYIVAGIGAFFACFPLIHVFLGVMMAFYPSSTQGSSNEAPPAVMGYFFIFLGGLFILMGWAMAVCTFLSGRFIAKRKHRVFSFVIAGMLCMFMPFGTVLGIFTIIVLSRESVQRLYADQAAQLTR